MQQPPGFEDPERPNHVCKLHKAIYGLKQAPRACFERFSNFLLHVGFICSKADPSMFILRGSVASSASLCWRYHTHRRESSVTEFFHFYSWQGIWYDWLGWSTLFPWYCCLTVVIRTFSFSNKVCSWRKLPCFTASPWAPRYLLARSFYRTLVRCFPTPIFIEALLEDCSISLSHGLIFPMPWIFFFQFMHRPTVDHFYAVKRIFRYVKGTLDHGRPAQPLNLYGYSDADWAGCPFDRRSTTGYCIFLGPNVVSWCAKKLPTVSRSSAEAEYRSLASAAAEVTWLQFLLRDLGVYISQPTTLLCDNISATYMAHNPVFHARTKHIEIDYHFVREKVASRALRVIYVSFQSQLADIFTKALAKDRFHWLRSKLTVAKHRHSTWGGVLTNRTKYECFSVFIRPRAFM